MTLIDITPVVLTFNEEANIRRCLKALTHFPEVVILDSGSTDSTQEICSAFQNTCWKTNPFLSFAQQWNHAIHLIQSPWMLALDADYILTPELIHHLQRLPEDAGIHGFEIPFRYCIQGKALKNSLLPPRITLFRPRSTHVVEDGHTQQFIVKGKIGKIPEPILHDDRKPFSRWWSAQEKYADQEVEKLLTSPWKDLRIQDKLRKLVFPAPIAILIYTLFWKGCLFDGKPGLTYTGQRFLAEVLLSFKWLVARLKT